MMPKVYLVDVSSLFAAPFTDTIWKRVQFFLDETRKSKLFRSMRRGTSTGTGFGAAADAGAGLLLQLAAADAARATGLAVTDAVREKSMPDKSEMGGLEQSGIAYYQSGTVPHFFTIQELLETLEKYLVTPYPLTYEMGERGKPFFSQETNRLLGGEVQFSLSHSEHMVLLAVDDWPLGADIQKRKPVGQLLLQNRHFSGEEMAWLHSHAPEEQLGAFYTLWTRKEALGKCTGQGVFSVLSKDVSDLTKEPAGGYVWWEAEVEEYSISVCFRRGDGPLLERM